MSASHPLSRGPIKGGGALSFGPINRRAFRTYRVENVRAIPTGERRFRYPNTAYANPDNVVRVGSTFDGVPQDNETLDLNLLTALVHHRKMPKD